ncbi:MAG: hypothetical protein OEM64_11425 [Gammaproteobacteria bacterium]|nr:hypothetical protein [Gammaproteobacteria bacterium]MDH3416910.1 hypothetical protein [Gammaproteobacteria bacterium]
MNGEIIDNEELDDIAEDIEPFDDDIDNVGDFSVEINVDELVAKIEADNDDDAARKKEIHRRMEEINERRKVQQDIDSTFNFNLDDDL